ncbi:MAG: response regulator [Desulfovibrionaceae bacterium]
MRKVSVLVVDDEPEFLALFSKRLARRNVDVTTAQSGEEALRLVSGRFFDVMVLDVRMPGLDGISTLRELRKVNTETEVILLTGHADAESAYTGMQLGAFDYMIKPVAFDELFAKIQDAASGH